VGGFQDTIYPALPVFAQNLACTWAGWRRARMRFTPHFDETLAAWEKSVSGPLDALHTIQRDRLFQLAERARRHVPFYRDLPPPVGARDPQEAIARTLSAWPALEKSTYRDRCEDFIARDLRREHLIRGKTSGTTGMPLPLWYSPKAPAEEFASIWRQRRSFGVQTSDPNLTFTGQLVVPFRTTTPPFWRVNHWAGQTLFSLYHMTPENLRAYVDGIHASPARYVQGYPSSIHLAARALLDAGRPVPPGRLAAVFTSSESLLAFQRETIEQAFGAPVRDRYGVSEFCVSMTACSERRLHVDMEFGIVEVEVEEETDDWQRGPLLATGLANDATPLLRYRVGDVGTRAKAPCPCGRPGDVFLDVDGRIEDYVMTPDGRLVGRLDHIFKGQLDIAEAQVVQVTKEAVEVRIVRRRSWNAASERSLMKEIRLRLGNAIRVELCFVDAIARESNGKFRAVKSAVGANPR
jgi:phenylacetate-CoA ligase